MYRNLTEDGPFKLKDSDLHIYSQILNEDFDNDNNPYIKMHLYLYSRIDGVSETEEIPLIKCENEYLPQGIIDSDYFG
jgi:hypothetical protein